MALGPDNTNHVKYTAVRIRHGIRPVGNGNINLLICRLILTFNFVVYNDPQVRATTTP